MRMYIKKLQENQSCAVCVFYVWNATGSKRVSTQFLFITHLISYFFRRLHSYSLYRFNIL